ncbi:hypothetical protein ASPFODRAFT_40883 [Aspergillus luchuensis CBS 106.47]|uniref:Uncharacterized protein n=1 Tax=Aspergillus luchuensis (strain CBS 106.47) TaxID=1137211 RepID=A0A1M3TUU6_ASPLC|nr:hypothetical protein ASPFODRAFT_40883 [Aspergillus luchuensis CBS 106.47]
MNGKRIATNGRWYAKIEKCLLMGTKEKAAKQRGSEREAEKGKGKEGGEISEGRRARRGGRMQERELRMQLGCRPEMKKK